MEIQVLIQSKYFHLKMRNCRTSKIDGLVDIYRNPQDGFDPEPTTIPFVKVFQHFDF